MRSATVRLTSDPTAREKGELAAIGTGDKVKLHNGRHATPVQAAHERRGGRHGQRASDRETDALLKIEDCRQRKDGHGQTHAVEDVDFEQFLKV